MFSSGLHLIIVGNKEALTTFLLHWKNHTEQPTILFNCVL